MNIDWSKAPKGTTGAMVANFDSLHNGGTTYIGKVEFIPSDEKSRNCYTEGRDGWTYYEFPKAWTGEGLPPVGTVCEWKEKTGFQWVAATVLFITDKSVVLQRSDGFEWQMVTGRTVFRAIRTPEQIAEEELKHSVNNMIDTMCPAGTGVTIAQARVAAERLYAAGYRKFEIVDEQP